MLKYDLGGVGRGGEYITVNLNDDADIRCDILNVDRYIKRDGCVNKIRLSHTLEHIPPQEYVDFILALRRKLKCGGRFVVIQTDAGSVIRQWTEGEISFRGMRSTLFPPGDRFQRNRLNAHF